ncbi:MAG: TIGR03067 domain-containing protein [Fimbriiglobus sp.]
MTRLRLMAMLMAMVCGVWVLAEDKKPEEKKPEKLDPAKLLGDWKVTEGMRAGKKSDEKAMQGVVTIAKEKMTFKTEQVTFVFGYKIDDKKDPIEIDLDLLEPVELKSSAKGIMKFVDGKLTLCYHPKDGPRPTKFESTEENGNYLFTHKKTEKKEEKK